MFLFYYLKSSILSSKKWNIFAPICLFEAPININLLQLTLFLLLILIQGYFISKYIYKSDDFAELFSCFDEEFQNI